MKRVLLWILGIVIVLGVAGAILLGRIDTQFVVNQIADATAKATGKPLVFASAPSLSLLPPGVNLRAALAGVRQGKLSVTDIAFILKGEKAATPSPP